VTVVAEPVLIGRLGGGEDATARAWAEAFGAAGIASLASDSILAALWGKVFYNAALNPLGALLGLRYGELADEPEYCRIMDRVITEAYDVARAQGVALPWARVEEYLQLFYERLVPSTYAHRSSMLQDIERGKPTEIDAICGEVCRRGDRTGVDTLTNRLLALLVRARSATAPASSHEA
jgi:2-dehydropantoate 2-reductase